jgi:ketose-bisphosphate aldolase
MIDASICDLEKNIAITQEVTEAARKAGVSVEAEIGHVGSNKKNTEGKAIESDLTNPAEASYFAEQTGVDALAVSIGTLHGSYRGTPRIDFRRLSAIDSAVNIPLVLHGGSGTGDENIRQSVEGGIRKINVFTDIIKPYLKETVAGFNPFKTGSPSFLQRSVVDTILKGYFNVSGSLGAASDLIE